MNTEIMALSDKAWRVFTSALMWSTEQGTDGRIPRIAMRLLYPEDIPPATIDELVKAGLVNRQPDGGMAILEWTKTQSAAADIEHQREQARERKRRERDRKKTSGHGASHGVTDGVTSRVSPLGKAEAEAEAEAEARTGSIDQPTTSAGMVTSWPVAQIPGGEVQWGKR